ncbi:MAG TPA: EI24 domain-containing protein [Kofleriaceae bacterium]
MEQLSTGLGDLSRGLAALRAHPRCWKYLIAPAVITAVLIVAIALGAQHASAPVESWLTLHLPRWLAGLTGGVMRLFIVVLVLVGSFVVFVPLAGLITGPFAEKLSDHLEVALTGRRSPPFRFGEFLHGVARAIGHGLRRVLASLAALVVIAIVGCVPVIGTIAALVATLWLTAHGAAYDCYDAVLGRRAYGYREKLRYLARHRGRTMGLGGSVALLLLVPVVNLFVLGVGAAGATVAALELER